MRPQDPRLRSHLAPARGWLVTLLAAATAGGLLVIGQAFALGGLIVAVTGDASPTRPATWLALVTVLRAVAGLLADVAATRAMGAVSLRLRQRVLRAVSGSVTMSRRRSGELALLLTRGIGATEPWFVRYLPAFALAGVLPLATLVTIVVLDPLSGLIVALTLPLVPVFAILIGLATKDRADRAWRQLSALSGHFLDVMRGLPTLVGYRRATAQSRTIARVTERYRVATLDTLKIAFASSVALELIATLSVALVAVSVGLRLAAGHLDFGTALVVLLLAPEAYWPLRRVGAEYHAAAEGSAAFSEAITVLESVSPVTRVADGADPVPAGPITAAGLRLGYGDRVVVAGLDATFARGLTAIAGPSGSGKSTLLAALVGELPPLGGELRVGGTPLRDVEPDAWRSQVAFAPQRPWLTAGTIAANVRVGAPDASDARVWRALERVDLGHTVLALPDGLETTLGEDGAGLSAGERARLALARVLVADRPVVVLDEPTAHLDPATEAVLLAAMTDLARTRTVIVVAHRQAVLDAADRVVRLPEPPATQTCPIRIATPARPPASQTGPAPAPARHRRWRRRWQEPAALALGAASTASGVALTATAGWLITEASTHPPVLTLMVAIVGVRTFGLGRPVLRYAERLVSHDSALRLLATRRTEVYDALVPLVPGRTGLRRGEVLTSVVDDVDAVLDERLRVRAPLCTAGLVGLGATAPVGLLDPAAALVIAALLAVTGLAAWGTWRVSRRAEAAYVTERGALSVAVEQVLSGARQLVLWQRLDTALAGVDERSRALARHSAAAATARAIGRATVVVAAGAGILCLALLVRGRAVDVSPAMAALLLLLPLALVDALLPAVDAAGEAGRCQAARARLTALLDLDPAVSQVANPTALPAADEPLLVERGGIPHHPVDLALGSGARIGVVGPSGTGKSTLAAQLVRFLDPESGRVRFGTVDAHDAALDDVRARVALVDDDPYVFSSSVVENVRLARPTATDAEVQAVLETVRLGPWLAEQPAGLHTLIGEGHAQVSGGERARLGLARALLAECPVVVLDEPTAHLDTATADEVAAVVLDACADRSLVWITHTETGLADMDQVVSTTGPGSLGAEASARRA